MRHRLAAASAAALTALTAAGCAGTADSAPSQSATTVATSTAATGSRTSASTPSPTSADPLAFEGTRTYTIASVDAHAADGSGVAGTPVTVTPTASDGTVSVGTQACPHPSLVLRRAGAPGWTGEDTGIVAAEACLEGDRAEARRRSLVAHLTGPLTVTAVDGALRITSAAGELVLTPQG